MSEFEWRPGIGDPTIGGWITVVLYFAAALNCWLVARRLGVNAPARSREPRAWFMIAVLFLLLGVNKQLDLQTALTEIGRMMAVSEGWYRQRLPVQIGFIAFTALVCAGTVVVLLIWARRAHPATALALVGTTFVMGFVLIRAASFHHIDRFIGTRFLMLRWNWIIEMSGITIVLIASQWRKRAATPTVR